MEHPSLPLGSFTLNLGLRRTFRWIFVLADVSKPISGEGFLYHFGFMVDLQKGRLVNTNTHLQIQCILAKASSLTPTFFPIGAPANSQYDKLLSEFPEVITLHNYNNCPIQYDVKHKIVTNRPTCVLQSQMTSTREAKDCYG